MVSLESPRVVGSFLLGRDEGPDVLDMGLSAIVIGTELHALGHYPPAAGPVDHGFSTAHDRERPLDGSSKPGRGSGEVLAVASGFNPQFHES